MSIGPLSEIVTEGMVHEVAVLAIVHDEVVVAPLSLHPYVQLLPAPGADASTTVVVRISILLVGIDVLASIAVFPPEPIGV